MSDYPYRNLNIRVPAEFLDRSNEAAKRAGLNQREWWVEAARRLLEAEGMAVPPLAAESTPCADARADAQAAGVGDVTLLPEAPPQVEPTPRADAHGAGDDALSGEGPGRDSAGVTESYLEWAARFDALPPEAQWWELGRFFRSEGQ